MAIAKRFVLIILSSLLILSTLTLTIGLTANTLLYSDIYQNALDETNIYEVIDESLQKEENSETNIQIDLTRNIINPEEFQNTIETNIKNILEYLRDDTEELVVEIEIDNESLRDFFEQSVKGLKECQEEDINFDNLEEITCRPATLGVEDFTDEILKVVEIDTTQNKIDLVQVFDEDNNAAEFKKGISLAKFYFYISIFATILFSLLIFFTNSFDIKSSLRWVSIPIFAISLITLTISLIMLGIMPFSQIPPEISELMTSLITPLIQRLRNISLIILTVGFSLFSISFLFNKRKTLSNQE